MAVAGGLRAFHRLDHKGETFRNLPGLPFPQNRHVVARNAQSAAWTFPVE